MLELLIFTGMTLLGLLIEANRRRPELVRVRRGDRH